MMRFRIQIQSSDIDGIQFDALERNQVFRTWADFLFIPGTGEMKLEPGTHEDPDQGYRSRYSHDKSGQSPNYYAVELADYGVKAEMTSGCA